MTKCRKCNTQATYTLAIISVKSKSTIYTIDIINHLPSRSKRVVTKIAIRSADTTLFAKEHRANHA